jgi:hypothetical protein
MESIQGLTDKKDAAQAILNYTHKKAGIEFDAFNFPNSTKSLLVYKAEEDTDGDGLINADCNNHAGLFATFLKGAGLTSRPMAVDWKHKHYDTANEIWLDGEWLVARGYTSNQGLNSRSSWGKSTYDSSNDLILTAGSNWEWDLINVAYRGATHEDYKSFRDKGNKIYPHYPANISGVTSEILKWDWVLTPIDEYWPGAKPATVIGDCTGNGNNNGCNKGEIFSPSDDEVDDGLITHPELAHFGQIIGDYGIDLDGDSLYDQLIVEVEVIVNQPGDYTIEATLNDTNSETQLGYQVDGIDGFQEYRHFEVGAHTISLKFAGLAISEKGAEGPYTISELLLSDLENPVPGGVNDEHRLDLQYPDYVMNNYSLADFDNQGADLAKVYTHQAQDIDGDGYIDRLLINTNLNMVDVDTYTVQADLTNSEGEVVASSTSSSANGQITLQFDAVLGSVAPYYLRNVELYNSSGQLMDSHGEGLAKFQFENFAYTTGPLYNLGIQTQSESLGVAGVTPVDQDGDGDYDSLDFVVNATIVSPGAYVLEGWLESSTGALLAWRNTEVSLAAGQPEISLSFDGQAINAFKANGPYKLVALKLSNLSGTILGKKDLAYQTNAFAFSDFEGGNSGAIFSDGIEAGDLSVNWNLAKTDWDVTQEAAYSPIHSWTDSPAKRYSSNTTTWLTSNPINVDSDQAPLPSLSFQSCHALDEGDLGKLQVRADGQGDWINVTSYEGTTNSWNLETVPLPEVLGASSWEFRFGVDANGSDQDDGWYVDDVLITINNDVDGDGISNGDEGGGDGKDTDGDGVPDYLDDDSDNDGIKDVDEGNGDSDGDGVSDFQDDDSDNDGIKDVDESKGDSDGDGIPDYLDEDADGDGVKDIHEGDDDTDNDGIPDYLDDDSDGDGVTDNTDSDNDGINDILEQTEEGVNHEDCTNNAGLDTDGDGIPNCQDNDVDGDGIPNYLDPDSDGDGKLDSEEGPTADSDGDGILDYLDSEDNVSNIGAAVKKLFLPLVFN